MSGSAESTPDAFTVALNQVLQLHQDQMRKLQGQLQMQYQLSAQQREQITELKKQLRRMKGAVSHAKSKVKHQSKLIHDLRKRIPATFSGSLLKCGSSPSTCTDQSGELSCTNLVCSPKPIGSPKRKAYTPGRLTACDESSQPETPLHPHNVNPTLHNAHTNTVNKTIDRTCFSLFSSSPISLPHTPATTQTSIASLERQEETGLDATAVGATEVSSLDSSDLQTSGSSCNDVIIVEDVTRFNPDHTPCQAPTQPAPSPINPQALFGASMSTSSASTPHNVDMEGVDGETGIEEEEREEQEKEEEKEEGDEGEDEAEEEEEGEEEEERNTSFPSRILPLGSGTCKGLSLRDGTGRFRYKELNRNTNSSVSASNSRNTICDTYMTTGSSNDFPTKISKLASSPESDSPPLSSDHSSHSSSATSPSSPSILRSSGSPWKQPRSPVVQVSLVVPSTRPGPQIPKSDSQLSLDISHTIPPSPELHTTSAKEDNRCVDHVPFENKANLLDQQNHAHPDPHPQGGQLCKSTKPPIVPSSHSKRPKKKRQHFKQPTLTQTVVDLSPSTGKHSSGNKQCISGVKQLNSSISDSNNVSLAPTVVLATPGMRPVSNIVGASFHVSHESMLPRVERDPPKRMLVCQDDQGLSQDLEGVLPCKKARRLDSVSPNEVSNLERTVMVSDDDVTRIIDLPSEDSEEEPSPVFNPPVVGSGDLSSNEPCSKEEGHDAPMNPVADETIGNGSEDINPPMDQNEYARTLAAKAGLPTGYKYAAVIRKKSDRDKLDAKPCPECQAWFAGEDGIHRDKRQHLMHTCRHKDLHLPPDSDSAQWEISFPSTESFEQLM